MRLWTKKDIIMKLWNMETVLFLLLLFYELLNARTFEGEKL